MTYNKTKELVNEEANVSQSETDQSGDKQTKQEHIKHHNFKETVAELEAKVLSLEEIIRSEKDARLRACAEMENFKKRKEQEKEDFCKYANTNFIKELLPILDSFDYAIEHAKAVDKHEEELIKGFILIQKQLHDFLAKLGVELINALNCAFDPNFHQAIMQEENPEVQPNTVVKEMQKGYKFADRIIRPSLVVVTK